MPESAGKGLIDYDGVAVRVAYDDLVFESDMNLVLVGRGFKAYRGRKREYGYSAAGFFLDFPDGIHDQPGYEFVVSGFRGATTAKVGRVESAHGLLLLKRKPAPVARV